MGECDSMCTVSNAILSLSVASMTFLKMQYNGLDIGPQKICPSLNPWYL